MTGVQLSDDAITSFTNFKLRRSPKSGFIIFKITDDDETIVVDQLGPEGATYDDFCVALANPDHCRYGVFTVNYDTTEGQRSKTGFFRWCPRDSTTHQKMIYAGSSGGIKRTLDGIQFEVQGGDFDDLDFEIILEKCKKQFN